MRHGKCLPLKKNKTGYGRRVLLNHRGSVLILVLWVVIFLCVTTVALNQQAQLSLAFVDQHIRHSRAKALAWAGLICALDRLREDSLSARTKDFDTLAECGIDQEQAVVVKTFRNVVLGEGTFNVSYKQNRETFSGIQDEDRKINLNAINTSNQDILIGLIEIMGFDQNRSRAVTASIVDWRNRDGQKKSAEKTDFESLEELLLVRGVSRGLYGKIKDYVTIYPKPANRLTINLETASLSVLRAIGRGLIEGYAHLTVDDADSLARKIVDFRKGDDGIEATPDDRRMDPTALNLNVSENILFQKMLSFKVPRSSYFTVLSQGTFKSSTVCLKVVIRREDLSILSFRIFDKSL
jgi:type II secretory pathway component PulK